MEQVTNVNPITDVSESEMNTIRAYFERAANSIVDASRLSREVASLREQVEALKLDIEHVREQNKWLDEQLHDLRQKRDELQRSYNDLQGQHISLTHDHERLNENYRGLETAHENVKRDRDEGFAQVCNLTDKLAESEKENAALRAKLEQISKLVGEVQQATATVHAFPVEPKAEASGW